MLLFDLGQGHQRHFKSHHSGMEMVGAQASAHSTPPTLNRTIVGWKFEEMLWAAAWELDFKSHHSGMESSLVLTGPVLEIPLNRTIVGWKLAPGVRRLVQRRAFKSHHSGMETRFS